MSELTDAQQLADSVQKLRIAYELYFAGVERFEPLKDRERVKKELRRLMSVRSNNTAYKFKLQSTQATLVTYENHWDRIVRQIEEGTFKRDKLKAQKHLQTMKDMTDEVELIEDEPVNDLSKEMAGLDTGDALSNLEPDDGEAVRELLDKGLLRTTVPVAEGRKPIAEGRAPMADSRAPRAGRRLPRRHARRRRRPLLTPFAICTPRSRPPARRPGRPGRSPSRRSPRPSASRPPPSKRR